MQTSHGFHTTMQIVTVLVLAACGATGAPAGARSAVSHDDYEQACAGIEPKERARCPLMRWTQSVDDVEGGVLLHLNEQAPQPAEAEKRAVCHRAWMAHDPANGMPTCPLGAPGIVIHASQGASGTDLALTASKGSEIAEVRRRAHAAYETNK